MDTVEKTEITVVIEGRNETQAFFVLNDHWSMTLCEIRNVLSSNDIELPIRYQFMTAKKNIIGLSLEESITLSKLLKDEEKKDSDENLDIILYVFPIPVTNESSEKERDLSMESGTRPKTALLSKSAQPSAQAEFQNEECQNDAEETSNERNKEYQANSNELNRCPMHNFNDIFVSLHRQMNWKILIKALLVFSFLLTCFLVLFVAMIHSLMCVVNPSEILGSFMVLNNRDSGEINSLKLQMKELEMTTKFEISDLRRRLGDLEDMYLKDIGILTEASAKTRTQVSQLETAFKTAYEQVASKLDSIDSHMFLKGGLNGMADNPQMPSKFGRDDEGKAQQRMETAQETSKKTEKDGKGPNQAKKNKQKKKEL